MAVHDLDMARYLAGSCPVDVMATGGTHVSPEIKDLQGSERFDTAACIVRFANGMMATIDVCRQSSYGYDQRAEVLGTEGMIHTDNVYPTTANVYKHDHVGHADLPYDFFLQRYNQAYVDETIAFCKCLTDPDNIPAPVSGKDGLCALVMALACDKSAAENRWVQFKEIINDAKNETTEAKLKQIHAAWIVDGNQETEDAVGTGTPATEGHTKNISFPERVSGVFASKRRESCFEKEE